jgi:hypothetical protein
MRSTRGSASFESRRISMRKKLVILLIVVAAAAGTIATLTSTPLQAKSCPKDSHLVVCPTYSFCCPNNAFCACL